MNRRQAERTDFAKKYQQSAADFRIDPVQIFIYFLAVNDAEAECDNRSSGDNGHSDVVSPIPEHAEQQTADHAWQSACSRQNQKWFEPDFRNTSGVTDHVLWDSGDQIQKEHQCISSFGVQTGNIIGHFFFAEKQVKKIAPKEFGQQE